MEGSSHAGLEMPRGMGRSKGKDGWREGIALGLSSLFAEVGFLYLIRTNPALVGEKLREIRDSLVGAVTGHSFDLRLILFQGTPSSAGCCRAGRDTSRSGSTCPMVTAAPGRIPLSAWVLKSSNFRRSVP